MARYYVNRNAQQNGDHEVHKSRCRFLPDEGNRVYLGDHMSCHAAVAEARRYYDQVNGCFFCSRECHTQ